MTNNLKLFVLIAMTAVALLGCEQKPAEEVITVDTLLTNGRVFVGGSDGKLDDVDVGVSDGLIVFVGDAEAAGVKANMVLDASGLVVAPGFIDPHTHSLDDLKSSDKNSNINYLTQGVTTVFVGNDGGGPVNVAATMDELTTNGMGTNAALYIGLGSLREDVMAGENRAPTADELELMKAHIREAMESGAIGFSTGLFYAPDNFAQTDEVIELAREAAAYGGVYDSHIRDESTYTVGLVAAIEEALQIGREADIHVHIAHIKALGVDVWGESGAIIEKVEAAIAAGQSVTADQYPWVASSTQLRSTLVPRQLLPGKGTEYLDRLRNADLMAEVRPDMVENMRRRGGPESLLIVGSSDPSLNGKTIADVADETGQHPIDAALDVMLIGPTRVASFNMNLDDIRALMSRDWVMTSSDGTEGHPRKYASFPKKYRDYVVDSDLLTLQEYLYRSSGLAAETFNLGKRGRIEAGFVADVIAFDPEVFAPSADFDTWNRLTEGVEIALVNGEPTLIDGEFTGQLPGLVIKRQNSQ